MGPTAITSLSPLPPFYHIHTCIFLCELQSIPYMHICCVRQPRVWEQKQLQPVQIVSAEGVYSKLVWICDVCNRVRVVSVVSQVYKTRGVCIVGINRRLITISPVQPNLCNFSSVSVNVVTVPVLLSSLAPPPKPLRAPPPPGTFASSTHPALLQPEQIP
jgi:hypothetical protein